MKGTGIRAVVSATRLTIAICLLTAFVINPLSITGQTKRGGTRQPSAPAASTKKSALATPAGQQEQLVRSRKSQAMSQAFTSGQLPDPLRLPAGNVDAQAAALAKSVSAGDEFSTPALHAAVLAAGFGVRDADGSVMQTTERGQGLAFEAWEIAAASKLYGEGYGFTLGHLGQTFAFGVPEFTDTPLAGELHEGIRRGAASEHPAVRFWARFIIELGRNSSPSYDLLRQSDATKIRLDAVQTFFILKRFMGDLAAVDRRRESAGAAAGLTGERNPVRGDARVSFIQTRMSLGSSFAKTPRRAESPCSVGDAEGVILDYSALASTTLLGSLAERLGGKLGRYGKAAGLANLILTALKFMASYALLKAEVTIDKHPLVRTKDTKPGEERLLSAKLSMDSDKWEMINCFRPALNAIGLDFNLPGAGPVADTGVEWKLITGGDSRGWIGTIEDFGDIMSGNATWGDAIVVLDAPPGADRSPAKQQTGRDGISRMGIVGVPQTRDLSNEKLVKLNKVAGVQVGIQLKTMKVTDKVKLASTLGDMAGNVLSFLSGDIKGGLLGTGTETLYRSHWYSSEPFYFVVNDWEPCAGLWQGTMTTTTVYENHTVETGKAGQDFVKKHDSSYRFEATIRFEGAKATATIESAESISGDQKSGYGRITLLQKRNANYSGEVKASASASSGRYDVGFELPRMYGTYESSGSCERPAPYKCQQPKSIHKPWQFNDGRYLSSISGNVDAKNPNEINDTKVVGEPGSLQHTITVNLKRCQ